MAGGSESLGVCHGGVPVRGEFRGPSGTFRVAGRADSTDATWVEDMAGYHHRRNQMAQPSRPECGSISGCTPARTRNHIPRRKVQSTLSFDERSGWLKAQFWDRTFRTDRTRFVLSCYGKPLRGLSFRNPRILKSKLRLNQASFGIRFSGCGKARHMYTPVIFSSHGHLI